MRTRLTLALVFAAAIRVATAQSPQALADAAYGKLQALIHRQESTREARAATRTVFSQTEMNAYLKYRASSWLPTGVTDPTVQFLGPQRIATLVTADLDGVRRKSSGGWFDPTAYLSGRLPVYVTGTLATSGGRGRFALEQATVSGVPVPKLFIAELLAYYTRSPENPSGLGLEDPFELPNEIQAIDVTQGSAVVIQ